jgi:hypothetical protein
MLAVVKMWKHSGRRTSLALFVKSSRALPPRLPVCRAFNSLSGHSFKRRLSAMLIEDARSKCPSFVSSVHPEIGAQNAIIRRAWIVSSEPEERGRKMSLEIASSDASCKFGETASRSSSIRCRAAMAQHTKSRVGLGSERMRSKLSHGAYFWSNLI